MTLGELVVKLGFNADTVRVKDFVRSIGEIPLSVAAAVGALTGIDFSLLMMTKNALGAAQGFNIFTSETGLSAKQLQKWQLVAEQMGVSGDTVTGSIKAIENALAQIRLGHGELLMPFGRLGVDVRGKNAYQILDQMRQRVGKYPPNVASALLSQIGVSPEMMALLRLSPGQFNRLASAAGGGMTDEQIKAFTELKASFVALGQVMMHDLYPTLEKVTPLLKDFSQALGEMLKAIGPFMEKFVTRTIKLGTEDARAITQMSKNGWLPSLSGMMSMLPKGGEYVGGPRSAGGMNLQQYIYSTASPEEVARHSISEFGRKTLHVAKNFGNAGY